MPQLAWFVDLADSTTAAAVAALRDRLARRGWPDTGDATAPAARASADAVVVWADRPLPDGLADRLLAEPAVVVLAGPTLESADPERRLAEAAGVWPGESVPRHDIRVRPGDQAGALGSRITDHGHAGAAHLGDHAHVRDRMLVVEKTADGVETLLVASAGLASHPVAAYRPSTGVVTWTLGASSAAVDSPSALRLLVVTLRHALRVPAPRPIRVGLLGYGAIGHQHSRAVRETAGLALAAVCDTSQDRLAAARHAAPNVRAGTDADALLHDDEVDLVVVSTPPRTHAAWARRALAAGKHVVVEKPLTIDPADADDVLADAAAADRLAVVYQNRRFDPDHIAIRRLVRSGAIGDVFHVETFVGGYGHPCNLWHSDAEVSGGAFYDWGSHIVDQLLDLVPAEVSHVTAAAHKLVWHDVTNADHNRLTMRFAGGAEAEFTSSDLAAALKPRWYVLGTAGAIVGHWRRERVVGRSDIGALEEDRLAPADSPPDIELHAPDGSVTSVALPVPRPHAFHAELADALLLGLPMSVTAEQSRRVVGVLAAAAESASAGGRPVRPR